MPRPPINLHQKVRDVLQHTSSLLPESECPIQHFERSANIGPSIIDYIDGHINPDTVHEAVYDRYFGHLRRMALAELIQSFERFLKELASVCVDHLAPYSLDERFDEFIPKRAEQIAALVNGHVAADRRLSPSTEDLRYVKRFLTDTADHTNERVGRRLAEILEIFHVADPTLFDAQTAANDVSRRFAVSITIHGCSGVL